jgi:hypothetical protein
MKSRANEEQAIPTSRKYEGPPTFSAMGGMTVPNEQGTKLEASAMWGRRRQYSTNEQGNYVH